MKEVIQIGAWWVLVGLLAGQWGPIAPIFRRALVLILLLLFSGISPPQPNIPGSRGWLSLLWLLLIGSLLWTLHSSGVSALLSLSVFLVIGWLGSPQRQKFEVLAVATIGFLLYQVMRLVVPQLERLIVWAFARGTGALFRGLGLSGALGPSAVGFHLWMVLLILGLVLAAWGSPKDFRARLGAITCGSIGLVVFVLAIRPLSLLTTKLTVTASGEQQWAHPVKALPWLALFLLPAIGFMGKLLRGLQPVQEKARLRWSWGFIAAVLVGLGLLLGIYRDAGDRRKGAILFYDRGYLNWDIPVFGRYGGRSGGMFGLLPRFVEALGYPAKKDSLLSEKTLEGVRTVVVINLQKKIPQVEKEALWEFVRKGGSLLAMGDHTALAGIREPLNDLLEPMGIGLNFDSAIPLRSKWLGCYRWEIHPMRKSVRSDEEIGISVGASLFVRGVGRPLIWGQYGFADKGNPNNEWNAYLDNMQYDPDEPIGDLVLVAEAPYGKGKVLVFGDTSSFQNAPIAQGYRFLASLFEWLDRPGGGPPGVPRQILSLLLIGLGLLVAKRGGVARSAITWLLIGTGAVLGIHLAEKVSPRSAVSIRDRIAVVDLSHLPRIAGLYWTEQGAGGLLYNLMRNGYLPLAVKEFEWEWCRPQLIIEVAPARPFSKGEVEKLEAFMREGGSVLLAVGWDDGGASWPLLKQMGFRLRNIPLGPVPVDQNSAGIQLVDAWPIEIIDSTGVKVLCQAWRYPVIVSRQVGKGQFLLIADSQFLLNRNLEGLQIYNEKNIKFLKGLLKR